jgi:ferric-dicitrate binding protein FerR (iron transport regulator)
MTKERFEYLLQQYLLQQMTEAELKEFLDAAVLPEFEPVLKAALDRDLQTTAVSGSSTQGQAMQSFENFKRLIAAEEKSGKYRRMRTGRTTWLRYAAIFLLVAGTVTWMLLKRSPDQTDQQQLTQQTTRPIDIAPGANKAMLTLADGTSIVLDSSSAGTLAIQGNARIEKTANGEVVYNLQERPGGELMMNTMTTPRGGQYRLTLPDGSKVWLNAASSITYPTAFLEKERVVTVTGEVYFEVATLRLRSGQKMPFKVKTATQEVEVLGTHFNINAYEDESVIKTTLLEGRVRVAAIGSDGHRGQTALLKPGEQVSLSHKSHLSQPIPVPTDQVMAWKNGIFSFHRASLHEVMRQLSRWYNVEVVYEKGIPEMEFGGEMGRDLSLTQVLKGFEDMEIHFKIEAGNRLIVTP